MKFGGVSSPAIYRTRSRNKKKHQRKEDKDNPRSEFTAISINKKKMFEKCIYINFRRDFL